MFFTQKKKDGDSIISYTMKRKRRFSSFTAKLKFIRKKKKILFQKK